MTESTGLNPSLATFVKPIFLRWEKLWKSKVITAILFVGGVLISIPCVMFFLPFAPMMGL